MPAISVFTKGGNLSPILFVIYLNAFLESLGKNYQGLHTLAGYFQNELELFMKLYILLYADDTIIMAESYDDLQAALNGLYDYCKAWSLSVNISKTKVGLRGHSDTSVHSALRASCTDWSSWPLRASDLTMHDTSCLNP